MGAAYAKSEGETLSIPQLPEKIYTGPAVRYYFVFGENRGEMWSSISKQYMKGRRLFVLKRKPLNETYIAIFGEVDNKDGTLPEKSSPSGRSDDLPNSDEAHDKKGESGRIPDQNDHAHEDLFNMGKDAKRVQTHDGEKATLCAATEELKVRRHRSKEALLPENISADLGLANPTFSDLGDDRNFQPSQQTWKHDVIKLWMHGQLRTRHKDEHDRRNEGKRKIWVTDILCLTDAVNQHVKPGQQIVGVCMLTMRTDIWALCFTPWSKVRVPVLKDAVNGVRCSNVPRLPYCRKKPDIPIHAIGVEIFTEEPAGSEPKDKYLHHIVAVPATLVHIRRKYIYFDYGVSYLGQGNIVCDWTDTFNHYLSQGFKLVDIYVDIRPPPLPEGVSKHTHKPFANVDELFSYHEGGSKKIFGHTICTCTMNQFQYQYPDPDDREFPKSYATWKPIDMDTLWIFSKPQSREQDTTPQYEGKIVTHAMEVKDGSGFEMEEVIKNMGKNGWELATFVERAGFWPVTSTFTPTVMMNTLLFFQRPLLAD